MLPNNLPSIRRAKPLLGTIVDITLVSHENNVCDLSQIIFNCFSEISKVQTQMSFFEQSSDIGRINVAKVGEYVEIHSSTKEVLQFANSLYRYSGGVFDVMYQGRTKFPDADFVIHEEGFCQRTAPVPIDLGGIAKGFAVDKARQEVEKAKGVSAIINAGGDIAFVGTRAFPLHVRSPFEDGLYAYMGEYSNCSIATSTINRSLECFGVSVVAKSCMVADALTKIVGSVTSDLEAAILATYSAKCLVSTREQLTNKPLVAA